MFTQNCMPKQELTLYSVSEFLF